MREFEAGNWPAKMTSSSIEFCHDGIPNLVTECCHIDPEQRPSFEELVAKLYLLWKAENKKEKEKEKEKGKEKN